jgi:drug/metabolite transporter (DMT)-like permease
LQDFPHAGEIYSLLAALVWACALVFLRKSGDDVPPVALNLFKNTVALALLVVTALLAGSSLVPPTSTTSDWAVALASGALGLGISDTLFLAGLNRLGAGRAAIVECCYSPSVVLVAWLYLEEPVGQWLLIGLALVVAAVLVGSLEPARGEPVPRRSIVVGVLLGAAAMAIMAIGIVIVKPVLARSDPLWVTTVRLVGGAAVAGLQGLHGSNRAAVVRAFVPSATWRFTLPSAFIGTYLSMMLWIFGMKLALATRASILNQTSTIFTLALATIFLREPLTLRKAAAIALGVAGAIVAVR